jgi:uncharacterized protein (DUF305 family)
MPARTDARTRVATAAASFLALTTVGLAGCGGDDASGGTPAPQRTAANGDVYNDADVEFATAMIPHHADTLVMVDLTHGRALSPGLARLAEDIRADRAPEIETMVDWLTAWGEEVPETSRDHVNSHAGHGGDGGDTGDGMGIDPDDLASLEDADAGAFESMWLEMMIEHHDGAIELAEAERAAGGSADAVALAESIATTQATEIEMMETMLDG